MRHWSPHTRIVGNTHMHITHTHTHMRSWTALGASVSSLCREREIEEGDKTELGWGLISKGYKERVDLNWAWGTPSVLHCGEKRKENQASQGLLSATVSKGHVCACVKSHEDAGSCIIQLEEGREGDAMQGEVRLASGAAAPLLCMPCFSSLPAAPQPLGAV